MARVVIVVVVDDDPGGGNAQSPAGVQLHPVALSPIKSRPEVTTVQRLKDGVELLKHSQSYPRLQFVAHTHSKCWH